MAKTNVVLSKESENTITKLAYLAKKDSKSKRTTPLKDEIIDTLILIADKCHKYLDEETFYNITLLEK
jgi:hypothetical protein